MRKPFLAIGAALVSALVIQTAASAAPSIDVDWNPRIPDHVENDGGLFTADCWVNTDGTTPQDLTVSLRYRETDELIFTISLPSETFYHLEYLVPNGVITDGVYIYSVEYTATDGTQSTIEQQFLIAGALTGLCAVKFIDYGGDGVYDAGVDDLASGWEMCANGPSLADDCELTDATGLACWFGITAGSYEVCETLQPGYASTTGGECQTIEVVADEINKILFGNWEPPVPTLETTWGAIKGVYR